MQQKEIKIAIKNRQARHNFNIYEVYEAGISLTGTEVKSLRQGKCNLKESYIGISKNKELIMHNCHISPFEFGNRFNHAPLRERKLLMHKYEIIKLFSKSTLKGYTLIPLKIYFFKSKAKVEIGLVTGKKLYDKRNELSIKESRREIEREMRQRKKFAI